jgi:hypothetical protein
MNSVYGRYIFITPTWKWSKCPSIGEWIKKLWLVILILSVLFSHTKGMNFTSTLRCLISMFTYIVWFDLCFLKQSYRSWKQMDGFQELWLEVDWPPRGCVGRRGMESPVLTLVPLTSWNTSVYNLRNPHQQNFTSLN